MGIRNPEMVSVFLLCVEMGIRSPEMAFGVPVVFPVCVEMGIRSPESAPVVFPVSVRVCQNRDSEPRDGFGAFFVFPEMVSVFLLCVEMGIRSPEMAFGVPVVFPACVEMGIRSPESAPVVFPVCACVEMGIRSPKMASALLLLSLQTKPKRDSTQKNQGPPTQVKQFRGVSRRPFFQKEPGGGETMGPITRSGQAAGFWLGGWFGLVAGDVNLCISGDPQTTKPIQTTKYLESP